MLNRHRQQVDHPPYLDTQQGLSLLELTIVISILALTAAVTLPQLSNTDNYRLDYAAQELAEAIRFAQAEAIRTGTPYGIYVSSLADTAKVYSNPTGTPNFNIYHPVDKKLYSLNFKTDTATRNVDLASYSIHYSGLLFNRQHIGFSTHGIPKYYESGNDHMLNGFATIVLSYAGHTRTVYISPMVGRVTVQ